MNKFLLSFICLIVAGYLHAQTQYKVENLRAAPGELGTLIETLKNRKTEFEKSYGKSVLLIRHSQGDSWDLMLIYPLSNNKDEWFNESVFFSDPFGSAFSEMIFVSEEGIYEGPLYDDFKEYIGSNSFYHVEMFVSLPGKQAELLKERELENKYLELTERKPNFIFTKIMGMKFDIFTLGAYESHLKYAEGGNQPEEVQEAAAKEAGFKSAGDIGLFLRRLILEHHDTLGNKIN